MRYEDLDRCGTEQEVRAEGLYMQKGRDYVVEDGDIIYFKFNVTAKASKIDKNAAKWWKCLFFGKKDFTGLLIRK